MKPGAHRVSGGRIRQPAGELGNRHRATRWRAHRAVRPGPARPGTGSGRRARRGRGRDAAMRRRGGGCAGRRGRVQSGAVIDRSAWSSPRSAAGPLGGKPSLFSMPQRIWSRVGHDDDRGRSINSSSDDRRTSRLASSAQCTSSITTRSGRSNPPTSMVAPHWPDSLCGLRCQGAVAGRWYGPAPRASTTLRAPAGPAAPVVDPRVPAGPGQGNGRAGRWPCPLDAPRRLGSGVARLCRSRAGCGAGKVASSVDPSGV